MNTPTHTTNIKNDYAQQIANDLTINHTAQQQTRDELQRLQHQLEQLEESAKVLLKMQEALNIPTTTPAPAPPAKHATAPTTEHATKRTALPAPRNTKTPKTKTTATSATAPTPPTAPATATRPADPTQPAAAAAAEVKTPRAPKTSSTSTSTPKKETKKETSNPSWLDLITATLTGQTEPKSAAEVTDTINTTHPQRKAQPAVIRNTLEQGVARGLIERTKQGRSVYYTPATPTKRP
ncbi:hypothetical protein [Streptomyces sp. DSM 41634]|uniref:hypothetical protein n=1 Tax=Streptomyces sp. DSM 41634 TaxID=3448656 RepID=UPI00403FE0DC